LEIAILTEIFVFIVLNLFITLLILIIFYSHKSSDKDIKIVRSDTMI